MNDFLFEKKYLAENLWQDDEDVYPWEHFSEEMEKYIEEKSDVIINNYQEAEENNKSAQFFELLNNKWERLDREKIECFIKNEYSKLVPETWLKNIIKRAKDLVGKSSDNLERLLDCVQPLFPDHDRDDLSIIGRPIAYAMRSGPGKEDNKLWQDLTEREKIKLTMKIAQSALNQHQNTEMAN